MVKMDKTGTPLGNWMDGFIVKKMYLRRLSVFQGLRRKNYPRTREESHITGISSPMQKWIIRLSMTQCAWSCECLGRR